MQRHREWFAERFKDSRLIVVGGEHAAWRQWRAPMVLQRLQRSRAVLVGATATLSTAVGVILAVTPTTARASLTATEYRIAGVTLRSVDGTTYTGAGALVIVHRGTAVRAAASATVAGRRVIGVCDLAPDAGSETCRFVIDGRVLIAHDGYRGVSWMRVYGDGQTMEIPADPGVPVPFPVGR